MQRDILHYSRDVRALDLGVVKIIKVVENRDGMSGSEQPFDQVRADKSGATGYENPHGANVETGKGSGKGRTFTGLALILAAFCVGFLLMMAYRLGPELTAPTTIAPALQLPSALELFSLPTATRFDFPIGSEHGALTYNAQRFTENKHLGDDLNGIGGENSDFGDPVYAVAEGRVLLARDGGPGWGNVIIVLHAYLEDAGSREPREVGGMQESVEQPATDRVNPTRSYVQSYYGHLDEMSVAIGQDVRRGEQLGTIGNADGRYWAHLHFEMREFLTPFVGPGYRQDTRGWINPTEFIQQHRGAPEDDVGR